MLSGSSKLNGAGERESQLSAFSQLTFESTHVILRRCAFFESRSLFGFSKEK